jgi:hypothetical protein
VYKERAVLTDTHAVLSDNRPLCVYIRVFGVAQVCGVAGRYEFEGTPTLS